MQIIWAPWRIQYILGEKEHGCFFCQKAKEIEDDRRNFVLIRSRHAYALMNIYPYNNGHLMVAPYAHVSSLTALDHAQLHDIFQLSQFCEQVLNQTLCPEGFNIGINLGKVAGAGVEDHLHVHIVPRWNGDTNYMTTVSQTRIIPQDLEELYDLLRPVFLRGPRATEGSRANSK